jgi:hypothetical protein
MKCSKRQGDEYDVEDQSTSGCGEQFITKINSY